MLHRAGRACHSIRTGMGAIASNAQRACWRGGPLSARHTSVPMQVTVHGLSQAIAAAMKAQRDMVADEMHRLLSPTETALATLEQLKITGCEEHPEYRNHLQMLCGACSALGWVTTADPKGYVRYPPLPPLRGAQSKV